MLETALPFPSIPSLVYQFTAGGPFCVLYDYRSVCHRRQAAPKGDYSHQWQWQRQAATVSYKASQKPTTPCGGLLQNRVPDPYSAEGPFSAGIPRGSKSATLPLPLKIGIRSRQFPATTSNGSTIGTSTAGFLTGTNCGQLSLSNPLSCAELWTASSGCQPQKRATYN